MNPHSGNSRSMSSYQGWVSATDKPLIFNIVYNGKILTKYPIM